MSDFEFVSINQLMKKLNVKEQLNIYFEEFFENKLFKGKWNIKPLGFSIDGNLVSNSLIYKSFPNLKYISNITDGFFKINKPKTFAKLMIRKETKTTDSGIIYHPKKLMRVNDEKLLKLLKDRMDVENKYERIKDEFEFDEEEPKTVEFEINPDVF